MVWDEMNAAFSEQAYIFGNQFHRINRCCGKVDVIVTDSPLLNSIVYNNDPVLGNDFNKVVFNVFNSFDNLNFICSAPSDSSYTTSGRVHTQSESEVIRKKIVSIIKEYNIPAQYIAWEDETADIIEIIKNHRKNV